MGIRVLVVEDDEILASSLVRGLSEEGYVVQRASDGGSAWAALRTAAWDAVVLDWWLPGDDGLSVLKRMRQSDRATPVIFLTARDSVNDRICGLDGGADDYLCKPFSFEELLARLRSLLRRSEERSEAVLNYRDVALDLKAQRVDRAGKTLDLTAKEYSLLVYLMRHPDQVLSRTRIYEHVWEDQYDGLSNTLEVHVMGLRRKLEMFGARLIHTLRGRGYLFGHSPTGEVEEEV